MRHILKNNTLAMLMVAVIAAIVFIPFIGNCPLFDWDEVNFAECAREMIVSNDYSHVQLNFRPFWEKPPLFIWLQALSMNVFGVNEFAARFPNAVCSIITLISLFIIGKKFNSAVFGLTWGLMYITSLLPHFYFKTGIIDPWFNLFILLSVYNVHRVINNPRGKREIFNAVMGGIFIGLAVLTKGPAALVYLALTVLVFLVWTRRFTELASRGMLVFIFMGLLVSASWFIIEWAKGNGKIIEEFLDYQRRLAETEDAGHGGPFYYHFLVLLVGCFPSSVFFIVSYFKYTDLTPYQRQFRRIMICLFWVILILFSIIKTKIVHYSSICYFPLTFIATIGLVNYFQELNFRNWQRVLFVVIASLIFIASLLLGLFPLYRDALIGSGLIKDEFAVKNLQSDIHWSGFEWLPAVLFAIGAWIMFRALVRKKEKQLFLGMTVNLIFIILTINTMVPKIDLYTQRAAIEFYRACSQHHCYIETHGFKSYAYLFYSNRKPSDYQNPDQKQFIETQLDLMVSEGHSRITSYAVSNQLWMEHGVIDRPAYIVIKCDKEEELLSTPEMQKLYEQNGYSFFVRMPAKTDK